MQYDLVFEGGGAKGAVFVGALQELERRRHTHGRLLGTSAGAIMATFVAAGFTTAEMLEALRERDENGVSVFVQFLGRPKPFTAEEVAHSSTKRTLEALDLRFIPNFIEDTIDRLILKLMTQAEMAHVFSFVERGGWFSADAFLDWAKKKLDQPTSDGSPRNMSHMTLAEFFEASGRELSLVAADTTDGRMLVLNHRTSPDVPLVWGMRMSMSLPFLWQEVVWQSEWGNYLGRSLADHRIVDGGLLSNFPIELFLSNDPHVLALMGPKISPAVLGMLIDESLTVDGVHPQPDHPRWADGALANSATVSRMKGLIETATQAHDKMVIEAFEQFVCRLPAKGYETTEFDMSDERREQLIAAGRSAMDHYFRSQEIEGMKGPDIFEMERAVRRANRLASKILQ